MSFDPSLLTGPLGGLLAIAYAAGAVSGYTFCLRTIYKLLKAQAEKDEATAKQRIEHLELEAKIASERLIHGMERQQAQVRDSTIRLVHRGRIKDAAFEEEE